VAVVLVVSQVPLLQVQPTLVGVVVVRVTGPIILRQVVLVLWF
jgi:hypothetical protein